MPDWLGIPAAFIAWGFALYVYIVAPATASSRLLVTMLVVDGIAVVSSYSNWVYIEELVNFGLLNWYRLHQASDWAVISVYLAFIGATVQAPLARPFSGPRMRHLVLGVGFTLAVAMAPLDEATLRAMWPWLYSLMALVLTWGFAASLQAWLLAREPATRARARAFTVAFGLRDTIWMGTFLALVVSIAGYIDANGFFMMVVAPVVYVLAVIVYVPLVAYGMLRTQLFDIDLRIKRTLRRSTVVATFVAVFFLISGLAELFLSNLLGNLLGLLITSALVFFLDPLQRAAERLSDAAMPETQNTPEYEAFRKLQVYESAMHAAIENGGIAQHQRTILDALTQSLGIDPGLAAQLERDALRGAGT